MCKDNTTVGGITLYVEDKGGYSLCIWKSIVTLIYRELLALGRKIDIIKLIYRYLLVVGR
jgi:hypothetical protein